MYNALNFKSHCSSQFNKCFKLDSLILFYLRFNDNRIISKTKLSFLRPHKERSTNTHTWSSLQRSRQNAYKSDQAPGSRELPLFPWPSLWEQACVLHHVCRKDTWLKHMLGNTTQQRMQRLQHNCFHHMLLTSLMSAVSLLFQVQQRQQVEAASCIYCCGYVLTLLC